MAGIGFRLRRMLDQESYLATIQAYLFAALISTGPWLITILILGLISIMQPVTFPFTAFDTFRLTIIYVYAFSLIVFGIIQMPLTRYLADLLYTHDLRMYLPTYLGALIVVGVVQFTIGGTAVFAFTEWSFTYAAHALILYVVVSFIWVAMIFITTARDYYSISIAFLVGGTVSLGGSYWLGSGSSMEGYLIGYTLGQVVIFLLLTVRLASEFRSEHAISFEFLRYLRRYPTLVIVGFTYNLAIWVDKMLFWFSPVGRHVDGFLHACALYDVPMFVAFLTIVPSMSLFLIRIETSFYKSYIGFYGAIVGKSNLPTIRKQKEDMIDTIKLSILRLLKLQGTIALVSILVVPYLIDLLPLTWLQMNILRVGILGAFLHVLFLLLSILLMYLEFRQEVMWLTFVFLFGNLIATRITLNLGIAFYGYGYLVACFLALAAGVWVLEYRIRDLEYTVFVQQPVH